MSETNLRILLSELSTIRLVCRNQSCLAVTELRLETMDRVFHRHVCPVCNEPFEVMAGGDNLLERLAAVVRMLKTARVGIEFVVPEPHPAAELRQHSSR